MVRNHASVTLLIALALLLAPGSAFAQPAPKGADDPNAQPAAGDDDDDDDDDDATGGDDDDDDGPGGLDELCEIDPENCVKVNMDEYAARDIEAEMYAVQQIWALRANRVETNLYYGLTLNDQFVAHNGPGLSVNYYILHELAVGVNGNLYSGLNSVSSFNFETSRAARIGQPITEYQFNANLNVTYVPAYGKFAAFQDFIFHYDFYVLLGGGVISTRPIAVVDPDNRTFDFQIRPTWGFGGGIRIFFTRYLAAMLEVRDYMFFDGLENPNIATGFDDDGSLRAQNPETWEADDPSFTNNVQAQLGLALYLPFSWEYELPK